MLVIGIGNRHRRDDGVGLAVVTALRERACEQIELVEHSGEASSLMALWEGRETIVVDATSSQRPSGAIRRVDLLEEKLAADVLATCSSHAFGLAQAVELARALGQLPPRLVLFGIEGGDFGHGVGLSDDVAGCVAIVTERILEELQCTR